MFAERPDQESNLGVPKDQEFQSCAITTMRPGHRMGTKFPLTSQPPLREEPTNLKAN